MSKHYAAPEEILYHVGFSAQQLQGATVAVLPGDPGRVEPLAKALGCKLYCQPSRIHQLAD